jgi:hypothetical protein
MKKVEILCESEPESVFWRREVSHRDQEMGYLVFAITVNCAIDMPW